MRFSVIIPTYNRAALVQEAIESVLAQTHRDFELIVVNDGSTDDTVEQLAPYQGRLTLISQPNGGLERAYDCGIAAACGDYLAFLDSDDLYFPDTLAGYQEAIDEHRGPPLVLGQPLFFRGREELARRPSGATLQQVVFPDYLAKDCMMFTSCSMFVIRRDVYAAVGGFRQDNHHRYGHEDFHLLLKLGLVGPVVAVRQPPLFAYRVHAGNSVRNTRRVLQSIAYLVAAERSGAFAGGAARRTDRYALLAGTLVNWFRTALRRGEKVAAIKLLLQNLDIVGVGVWQRVRRQIRRSRGPRPATRA